MKLTDSIYIMNLIRDFANFGIINKEDSAYYHKLRLEKVSKEDVVSTLMKRSKLTYTDIPHKYRVDINFVSLLIRANKGYVVQVWDVDKNLAYDALDKLNDEELSKVICSIRPSLIYVMHQYLKERRNVEDCKKMIEVNNNKVEQYIDSKKI